MTDAKGQSNSSSSGPTAKATWLHRLKPDVRLLAIASCNLGLNVLLGLFNFYYVKVFLEHHGISQRWLYYAQMAFIGANFIVGPTVAYAQDYGVPAMRNRRKLILIAGPLFAASFLLPWFPWYSGKEAPAWAPGLHLMIVLLLWNTFYFVVNACNCGLFAEVSTDRAVRVKSLTYNQLAACFASCAVFPVDTLSKSVREYGVFQICCGVAAGLAAACFVFTGLKASDEVAQADGGGETEEEDEKPKVGKFKNLRAYVKVLRQIFSNRNFWCIVIANFFQFFRVCVSQNFLAVYTEGLISEKLLPPGTVLIAVYYLAAQLTPKFVMAMAAQVIKRFGPKKTLLFFLALTWLNAAIGLTLGTLLTYNAMIGTLLVECILVVFQDAFVIFYSEVIDEDAKKYNRSRPASTMVFTMSTLFLQPSTALAPMVIVWALNTGDYDEYKGDIRSAPFRTKQVMFLVANIVPAVAALLSFVSLCFYKGKKQEDEKNAGNEEEENASSSHEDTT